MIKQVINGLTRFDDNPSAFETIEYDEQLKEKIIKYMESFEPSSVGGYIDDCRTGETIIKTNSGYEDGVFCWCSQDIYHIKKYNAAVSNDFINHVIKQS